MAFRHTVIAIVGPTASGKTSLAIEIAKQMKGEIICADSRTVFREMDIGTAKPTELERRGVVHWGLDLVQPNERFTAADFQQYAFDRIADIQSRGKVPIVVGGTGLYVDGVLFEYQFPAEMTPELNRRLSAMSTDELYKYCVVHNIELPINDKNQRHLIRSIAHAGSKDRREFTVKEDTHVFGIAVNKSTLEHRIMARVDNMFEDGVVEEAQKLFDTYSDHSEAMTASVYPLLNAYLTGETSLLETKESFIARDRQLAKRQMTWFRRNPYISWGTAEDIEVRIKDLFTTE